MRIDVELFTAGETAGGALLVAQLPAGMTAEIHRHPRAGSGNANAPTHELRIAGGGVVVNDVALWKKSSDRGEYLNGQLLKGGHWWVSVNYLDQDAASGAVAKLTIRHSPPKQQDGGAAGAGADELGGRF